MRPWAGKCRIFKQPPMVHLLPFLFLIFVSILTTVYGQSHYHHLHRRRNSYQQPPTPWHARIGPPSLYAHYRSNDNIHTFAGEKLSSSPSQIVTGYGFVPRPKNSNLLQNPFASFLSRNRNKILLQPKRHKVYKTHQPFSIKQPLIETSNFDYPPPVKSMPDLPLSHHSNYFDQNQHQQQPNFPLSSASHSHLQSYHHDDHRYRDHDHDNDYRNEHRGANFENVYQTLNSGPLPPLPYKRREKPKPQQHSLQTSKKTVPKIKSNPSSGIPKEIVALQTMHVPHPMSLTKQKQREQEAAIDLMMLSPEYEKGEPGNLMDMFKMDTLVNGVSRVCSLLMQNMNFDDESMCPEKRLKGITTETPLPEHEISPQVASYPDFDWKVSTGTK